MGTIMAVIDENEYVKLLDIRDNWENPLIKYRIVSGHPHLPHNCGIFCTEYEAVKMFKFLTKVTKSLKEVAQ